MMPNYHSIIRLLLCWEFLIVDALSLAFFLPFILEVLSLLMLKFR